ncbi:hypothetical protein C2E23DRAFT_882494 [Lenzites betulinus]|nr:hypothetical protein C2E23DRAFT_882494 [Lenzites betulinus]
MRAWGGVTQRYETTGGALTEEDHERCRELIEDINDLSSFEPTPTVSPAGSQPMMSGLAHRGEEGETAQEGEETAGGFTSPGGGHPLDTYPLSTFTSSAMTLGQEGPLQPNRRELIQEEATPGTPDTEEERTRKRQRMKSPARDSPALNLLREPAAARQAKGKAPDTHRGLSRGEPRKSSRLERPLFQQLAKRETEKCESLADALARTVMDKCRDSITQMLREAIEDLHPESARSRAPVPEEARMALPSSTDPQAQEEEESPNWRQDEENEPQENPRRKSSGLRRRLPTRQPKHPAEAQAGGTVTSEPKVKLPATPAYTPAWGGPETKRIMREGQWTTAAQMSTLTQDHRERGQTRECEEGSRSPARRTRDRDEPETRHYRPAQRDDQYGEEAYEIPMDVDRPPPVPRASRERDDEDEGPEIRFDWTIPRTERPRNDGEIPGPKTTPDMSADQIWEARLEVIETMGLAEEPAQGFPKIHFRNAYDLTRHHSDASIAKWKAAPAGTALILDVYGQDNVSDQRAEATHANLVRTIGMITGMPAVNLEAPPRASQGVRKWDAGTAWLGTNFWPGAAELLKRLRHVSTDTITFSVHERANEPQAFLTALTGFTSWDENEIKEKVMWELKTDPAYSSIKGMVSVHPDYQGYANRSEATTALIKTVEVKVRRISTKTSEMPVAFIYVDPPTTNSKHWTEWRKGLETHVFSRMGGRVKIAQRDFRCEGCHGAEHQTHQCPLNPKDIPGWKGTVAPRPTYFLDLPQQSAPQPQYQYQEKPRSPRPMTPTPGGTWQADYADKAGRSGQDAKRKPPSKPASKRM